MVGSNVNMLIFLFGGVEDRKIVDVDKLCNGVKVYFSLKNMI